MEPSHTSFMSERGGGGGTCVCYYKPLVHRHGGPWTLCLDFLSGTHPCLSPEEDVYETTADLNFGVPPSDRQQEGFIFGVPCKRVVGYGNWSMIGTG